MSATLITAGQTIRQNLPFTADIALRFEGEFDAITGRQHSLQLKDDGMPQHVGAELNQHLGSGISRLGTMNAQAAARGRTNERSDAVVRAMEELVSKYI